jgi:hypothetical protein
VVDEEEVGALFCGELHGGVTQVDRCPDPRDLAAIAHLQSVQRIRRVTGVPHLEIVVEILDECI